MNHTDHLTYEKLNSLAAHFGSSFYLLNSRQFERNYTELKAAFCTYYPHFNIAYSYKTNYIPRLCQLVDKLGGYAEVVSEMELTLALRCGVKPERIIWNGPVKQAGRMEALLLQDGVVNADSTDEVQLLCAIADAHPDRCIGVGLRCNFDVGDGVVSRFGIDAASDEFAQALAALKQRTQNMRLVSLHCHFANRSASYWPARVEGMLRIVDRVSGQLGYLPERVDLGGGMYGKMADSLKSQFSSSIPDYPAYAAIAAAAFANHFKGVQHPPELLVEPGSALAGDVMKYVTRVNSIKTVRKKTFATLTGSQKNISMSGVNPPIEVFNIPAQDTLHSDVDMVGYTCIESDVLYRGYCGALSAGDYVVFGNCGSYSIVMKPPFIQENVPVIDICQSYEHPELIKRSECFEDVFGTYCF